MANGGNMSGFRTGDRVVFVDEHGMLAPQHGWDVVKSADLSVAIVRGRKFNAGTGKRLGNGEELAGLTLLAATDDHIPALQAYADHVRKANKQTELLALLGNAQLPESKVDALEAIVNGQERVCATCEHWRPPHAEQPFGDCLGHAMRTHKRVYEQIWTIFPPTLADFGCNGWSAKDEPSESK
jgi:hypothetical protein